MASKEKKQKEILFESAGDFQTHIWYFKMMEEDSFYKYAFRVVNKYVAIHLPINLSIGKNPIQTLVREFIDAKKEKQMLFPVDFKKMISVVGKKYKVIEDEKEAYEEWLRITKFLPLVSLDRLKERYYGILKDRIETILKNNKDKNKDLQEREIELDLIFEELANGENSPLLSFDPANPFDTMPEYNSEPIFQNERINYELYLNFLEKRRNELIGVTTLQEDVMPSITTNSEIQKVLMIYELGIFDYLAEKFKIDNPTKLSQIIESFSGIKQDTIRQPYRAIIGKDPDFRNNPYKNSKNVEFIINSFHEFGIKRIKKSPTK